MLSHPPPRDDPRDAHLLAALRHAPDRDVVPPAALTAAILDRAQQALQPPRAAWPQWRDALRGFIDKLLQPAPMAAFATLAMATLIGVMWGVQDIPEATPSLRPEPAAVPLGQSSKASGAVTQAPLPRAGEREGVASSTAERRPLPISTVKQAATPKPPPATPAGLRQDAAQEAAAQRSAAPAPAPPPSTNDAAGTAPTPAPAAETMRITTEQRAAGATASADTAPTPLPLRARSEFAGSALGAAAPAIASPLAPAAAEIDAAISNDAARVRWRVNARHLVAHDAAQRDWWSALARSTQGRWLPVAPGSVSGTESEALTLLIDAAPRGRVSFEPQAVVWRDAGGVAWRAPVAASTIRAWQEVVMRW